MGYGEYLEERGGEGSRAEILEALGEQETSPRRLLERLTELREILQRSGGEEASMILSTIHSSKGLEYDTVYLLDAMDGVLPKEGDDTDLEEERRLFYVAMTRAKNELNIFTFGKSSFARTVFPKEPVTVRPLPRSVSARRAKPVKAVLPPEEFYAGREVQHRIFGPGRIVERENDILTLELEDGTRKRLLLSAALGSGVLNIR